MKSFARKLLTRGNINPSPQPGRPSVCLNPEFGSIWKKKPPGLQFFATTRHHYFGTISFCLLRCGDGADY
jgi:hypothetical protein